MTRVSRLRTRHAFVVWLASTILCVGSATGCMSFTDVSALAVTIPSENQAATFERLVTVARGADLILSRA